MIHELPTTSLLGLLVKLSKIEVEFLSFQNITVTSSGLSGSAADASQQSTLVELFFNVGINESFLDSSGNSGLNVSGLLDFGGAFGQLLLTEFDTVMSQVPLSEGSGIDLDDGTLDQGVGSDQFVVRSIVDDLEDLSLSGDLFRRPGVVTGVELEGLELVVTTSNTESSDSLFTDLGKGSGTTGFVLLLLLVDGHTTTGKSSLVSGVSRDTHDLF